MTFAYDLRYACDHFVGIGTYAFAVLEALLALPGDERYVVLWDPRRPHERFDLSALRAHPRVTWVERPFDPLAPMGLAQVGAWLRGLRPAAYFGPFHFLPVAPGCACVLAVHDVRPLRFSSELPLHRRIPYRLMFRRARGARLLLAVSEFSRTETIALLGADPGRVRTVRPGVQPGLMRLEPRVPRDAPERPFALVVGDNRPHKNHGVLAEAWATLGASPALELVGAGPTDPDSPDLVTLARRAGSAARHLGRVSEGELAWLYRHATLLLFPSRYEGFGSPLAEALAHGLPAVVSDIPVFREIAGGAACFVSPDDAGAWAAAVAALAGSAGERERLARAGRERAANLTYDRTARGVLAALQETNARGPR